MAALSSRHVLQGLKTYPNAMAAGPAAAMLSTYGGALWRYLYNKGRGENPKVEWMNPGVSESD